MVWLQTIVRNYWRPSGDKRRWPFHWSRGFSYEAEIRDDQNRPLPAGEIGEICIKRHPRQDFIFKRVLHAAGNAAGALEPEAGYIPVIRVTGMRMAISILSTDAAA